jgi:hypothetical protein
MKRMTEFLPLLSSGIIIVGCMLTLAMSLALMDTGAHKLSFAYLLLGILPYVIYGSFFEPLKHSPVLILGMGIILLAVDLLARIQFQIFHSIPTMIMPAVYLCLVLSIMIFTAGLLAGKEAFENAR